jgi:hypothetical protein
MKKDKIDYFELVRTTKPIATSSGGEFIGMVMDMRRRKAEHQPPAEKRIPDFKKKRKP